VRVSSSTVSDSTATSLADFVGIHLVGIVTGPLKI
jgi:hypothetical protein